MYMYIIPSVSMDALCLHYCKMLYFTICEVTTSAKQDAICTALLKLLTPNSFIEKVFFVTVLCDNDLQQEHKAKEKVQRWVVAFITMRSENYGRIMVTVAEMRAETALNTG